MDRVRFSTIAHANRAFCAPVSVATFDCLTDWPNLRAGDTVLDLGCGKAAMLLRLIERFGVIATGVDTNEVFLAEARSTAQARGLRLDQLRLLHCDAGGPLPGASEHALVLCIGATYALGGFQAALDRIRFLVRPGGCAILGEVFWQQPPDDEYLVVLGASRTDLQSHPQNLADIVAAGWEIQTAAVSSLAEWDDYEDDYAQNVVDWLAAHPDDPEAPAFRERIRTWRAAYLQYGRETLGFALYLMRRPGSPGAS